MEAVGLLMRILTKPGEVEMNMMRYSSSVIYTLAYGKRMSDDDRDLKDLIHIMDEFVRECYPGAHLVDTFPILDRLPDFLSPWRKAARKNHENEMKVRTIVF